MNPFRSLFDIPDNVAYFNCAYMGPQLRACTAAGQTAIALKARPWTLGPTDFFAESEKVRALAARLFGPMVDAADVALVPSVSYGIGVASRNIPVRAGQKIVMLEEQFPSNVYPWRAMAAESGAEAVHAPRDGGGWTASLLALIDECTAVVAIPQAHWADGTWVDLDAVARRCRQVGAALVLDLTQTLGAVPFDAGHIEPDFAVAAAYKWLLGPYSMAFLYVHPRQQGGAPLEHNWIARIGAEDFAGLVRYRDQFQPGARRFDVGERSNFGLLPVARVALEQILAWTPEAIAEETNTRTARIASAAEERGWIAAPQGQRSPHLLGLRRHGQLPEGLAAKLTSERVYVSLRGDCVRISPHLFNTDEDEARLLACLRGVSR